MPYEFGDVVLVPFPFTNQATSKRRPAAVVSNARYNFARGDVVVMAITSQLRRGATEREAWVDEWQLAGLLKPSAVKPVIATLEQALVITKLGSLTASDQARLRALIMELLG